MLINAILDDIALYLTAGQLKEEKCGLIKIEVKLINKEL